MAASMSWSFDFILMSQRDNNIESDIVHHLFGFMQSERDHQILHNTLMTFVASSILLNAYFPKMHDKTILTLANMNIQYLTEICRLWFRNALWHSILTSLSSVSYQDIWWSQSCSASEHLHSQSVNSTSFLHDCIWEVYSTDAWKKDYFSQYWLGADEEQWNLLLLYSMNVWDHSLLWTHHMWNLCSKHWWWNLSFWLSISDWHLYALLNEKASGEIKILHC